MAVNLEPPASLLPIAGARWGTGTAAIKKPGREDMALLALAPTSTVAGVYTRNVFAAAPVVVARQHMSHNPRALLVNSGNANAGNGQQGEADALACCSRVATMLGLDDRQVLPFSTGVIGQPLPVERMVDTIPELVDSLQEDGWAQAAQAIMTTDTVPKGGSRTIDVNGDRVSLTGIAKGSGMIRPDMATMLSFIATDATIAASDLELALKSAVDQSFNSITVDGDTSTNDSAVLCATGSGSALSSSHSAWAEFVSALSDLMIQMACAIVRDGEGATRFISLIVSGAASVEEARQVGFTVAHSPLFKTAAFAGDPNWGRILAAVGRSPVKDLDIGGVNIALDDVAIVTAGEPNRSYREADGAAVMARPEFSVHVGLGRGRETATVWTSDLSYEYVRINAEYRS